MELRINYNSMEISSANFKYSDDIKKKNSIANIYSIRILLINFVIFLFITLSICTIFLSNLQLDISKLLKQFLFATIFFLMGFSHILFFPKWIKSISEISLKFSLLYSLAFATTLGCTVFLYLLISNNTQSQFALVAACSFLLPLIIGISWTCFNAIDPVTEIKPWLVPIHKTNFQNRINVANSFGIKFSLKMYYFDEVVSEFDVVVAGGFRLGKIFHEFLVENDTEETKIQQLDYQLKPYGWMFFVKKFTGVKMLDPGLTFLDSDIKENDVIIIERVNIA